ncbi:hypothetical protein KI387_012594, partial [Taxus chinensis]
MDEGIKAAVSGTVNTSLESSVKIDREMNQNPIQNIAGGCHTSRHNEDSMVYLSLITLRKSLVYNLQMTVLLGSNNTLAIHKGMYQLEFSLMSRLENVWRLLKEVAADKLVQGRKIDAIFSKIYINPSSFFPQLSMQRFCRTTDGTWAYCH